MTHAEYMALMEAAAESYLFEIDTARIAYERFVRAVVNIDSPTLELAFDAYRKRERSAYIAFANVTSNAHEAWSK